MKINYILLIGAIIFNISCQKNSNENVVNTGAVEEVAEPTIEKIYDAPDQAVWHAPTKTWFVSNLGGGISLDRDNYAWITKTDAEGNVIDPFWIDKKQGLHAVSGMIVTENLLFACDRDGVYEIDIAEGKIKNFYKLDGGEFINDIAMADNGDLYISDFFGNKIYKIPADTKIPEVWLKTPRLESPDGLYMDNGKLVVGSWGVLKEPNSFDTTKLGDLLSIDLETKEISVLVKELGNLEGITKAGDYFYITDWASGKVLKVNPEENSVVTFISGLSHPTDPNYSKELNTLAFPQHGTDQVLFIKL